MLRTTTCTCINFDHVGNDCHGMLENLQDQLMNSRDQVQHLSFKLKEQSEELEAARTEIRNVVQELNQMRSIIRVIANDLEHFEKEENVYHETLYTLLNTVIPNC